MREMCNVRVCIFKSLTTKIPILMRCKKIGFYLGMFSFFQVGLMEDHCCKQCGPFSHNEPVCSVSFCILLSRVQIRSVSKPPALMRMPYLDSFGLKWHLQQSLGHSSLSIFSPTLTLLVLVPTPIQSLIVELSEQLNQSGREKSTPSPPSPHLSPSLSAGPERPQIKGLLIRGRKSCPILFGPCRGM